MKGCPNENSYQREKREGRQSVFGTVGEQSVFPRISEGVDLFRFIARKLLQYI